MPSTDHRTGTLFVVATPIGNLEDITLRALRIFREADLIAAEDTRHTRKLLSHYQIRTPLVSYHEHNKELRTPELIARLKEGTVLALVTDAGTPSVSDPGYRLVCKAIEAGIPVIPAPGACAAIAALSVSGFSTDTFCFVGFLSRKKNKKKDALNRLKNEGRTFIIYESPYRLPATLELLLEICGDRKAVLARELTKCHEEIVRGRLSTIIHTLSERVSIKGECTLLVEGAACREEVAVERDLFVDHLRMLRKDPSLSLKDAVALITQEYGVNRKKAYAAALEIWRDES